ncbi:Oxoglutarate/iron-dependent dioxygenase [Penicillium alfredii]|uniref:Oxoglutarate/iron-dependent dioxygenase n=1 Tax=Penicillium alfredii TaxID=1506179 RepID=A0A9W9JWP2_9EURO|nr:Oxoglutarate/iron-dependent dioxygenase [Penicillium alfredii]KAJ5084614.1 Oxoglutarate/iron-dependent dioxygenase [Penicillium alfredii]
MLGSTGGQTEFNLEAARISALPADAFYISNFLSEDEERWLLQKVTSAPLPRWTQLSRRRLQTWPSALTKTNTLLASPLPGWLVSPIIEPRFKSLGIFEDAPHGAPNHVLVNEYQPGQGSCRTRTAPPITHSWQPQTSADDGMEESEALAETSRTNQAPQFRILQERRSLLITRGKLYTDFLHGIAETTTDAHLDAQSICNWDLLREINPYQDGCYQRETRTSLTYRDVLKVAKMGNTMKFLGGR